MLNLRHIALVALAALLFSACSGTTEPASTNTSRPPAQMQPTETARLAETATPTEAPTQPPPTVTEAPRKTTSTPKSQEMTATPDVQSATDTPDSTVDTPVPNEEPTFSFLDVGPDEWVIGPDDATVTIIEYSDFQ